VSSTVHGRIEAVPTLNIKDPKVYELAGELARRRATSMTGAVRQALTEALERTRLTPEEKILRMKEIAQRVAAIPGPYLTDDDLYDERGLPK
jgi:antitoxin VapB